MSKPIASIRLPAHHPAVSNTKDGETIMLHATRAPKPPKRELPEMPKGMTEEDRPMNLEDEFHITHIEGMAQPAKKKGNPLAYLKRQQATEVS